MWVGSLGSNRLGKTFCGPFGEGMKNRQPLVYEYITPDGVVFWSFTRLPTIVTHSQKLILDTKEGTPLTQYVADLRGLGKMLGLPLGEKE